MIETIQKNLFNILKIDTVHTPLEFTPLSHRNRISLGVCVREEDFDAVRGLLLMLPAGQEPCSTHVMTDEKIWRYGLAELNHCNYTLYDITLSCLFPCRMVKGLRPYSKILESREAVQGFISCL